MFAYIALMEFKLKQFSVYCVFHLQELISILKKYFYISRKKTSTCILKLEIIKLKGFFANGIYKNWLIFWTYFSAHMTETVLLS